MIWFMQRLLKREHPYLANSARARDGEMREGEGVRERI